MSSEEKGGMKCCVKMCQSARRTHRSIKNRNVTFHRFPTEPLLKKEWIRRIQIGSYSNRIIKWEPKKSYIVCGFHFNETGIRKYEDKLPVYIGNHVFPKNTFISDIVCLDEDRSGLLKNIASEIVLGEREARMMCSMVMNTGLSNSAEPIEDHQIIEHNYFQKSSEKDCLKEVQRLYKLEQRKVKEMEKQLTHLDNVIKGLKVENHRAQDKILELNKKVEENKEVVERSKFLFKNVKEKGDMLKYYTGFSSSKEFERLFEFVEPNLSTLSFHGNGEGYERKSERVFHENNFSFESPSRGRPMSLHFQDQLFLTLCKLKAGLSHQDLSYRFNISNSTVSNIIITWIDLLHKRLTEISIWPSKENENSPMPAVVKEKLPRTRFIIDASEIFIEDPDDCGTQSDMSLEDNKHNIVPHIMSGSALTTQSGPIDLPSKEELITSDSGCFNEEPSVEEEKVTREHHVERVTRSFKHYRILKFPNSLHATCSLEKIWQICCRLVTFVDKPTSR